MSKRYGRQTPTFERVGTYDHSDGPEAVALFEGYGIRFIPAQRYEMELYLAKNELGEAEAINIGLSRPRQNGKSFAARYYALWAAFIEGRDVLYSAHHAGTVRKMFKFMCDFIAAHRDFSNKLKPQGGIYKAQGAEGIYLADGHLIEFSTRTNSGSRGGTYDVIVVDEAQELTAEQRDALMPTTIAGDSGDPQTIYIGTPPNHKCPGTVFHDMHDRAHAGELGEVQKQLFACRVLGVEAEPVAHERAHGVVLLKVALGHGPVRVPGGDGAAEHGAEAAVEDRLDIGVAVVVHVEAGGDAAGEQLEDAETRKCVYRLRVELGLPREDLLEQPLLQGQAVGEGAQEDHGYVRVRVLEARYDEVAAEVELALEFGHIRPRGPDIAYEPAVCPELALHERAVIFCKHGHEPGVIQSYQSHRLPKHFFISDYHPQGAAVNCKSVRPVLR